MSEQHCHTLLLFTEEFITSVQVAIISNTVSWVPNYLLHVTGLQGSGVNGAVIKRPHGG